MIDFFEQNDRKGKWTKPLAKTGIFEKLTGQLKRNEVSNRSKISI